MVGLFFLVGIKHDLISSWHCWCRHTYTTWNHINSFDIFPWGGIRGIWHIDRNPSGKETASCSCFIHSNSPRTRHQTLTSLTSAQDGSNFLTAVSFVSRLLVFAECMCSVTPYFTLSYTHSHLADTQDNQSFYYRVLHSSSGIVLGWSVIFKLISTVATGGSVSHPLSYILTHVFLLFHTLKPTVRISVICEPEESECIVKKSMWRGLRCVQAKS